MASREEYLRMMKRMDNESVLRPDEIESTTADLVQDPALKDLMLPPMPMSKFSDMLRKADPLATGREGENVLKGAMGAGMMVDEPTPMSDSSLVFDLIKAMDPRSIVREGETMVPKKTGGPADFLTDALNEIQGGRRLTDAERNQLGKMLDDLSVAREEEISINRFNRGNLTDDMLSDLGRSDREAVEALTSMGVPLETALETLMETEGLASALGKPETNPMTMPEGALGSLPTRTGRRTGGAVSDKDFDPMIGDKTQSLDMQDTATGT